jgi:hypothetical protein
MDVERAANAAYGFVLLDQFVVVFAHSSESDWTWLRSQQVQKTRAQQKNAHGLFASFAAFTRNTAMLNEQNSSTVRDLPETQSCVMFKLVGLTAERSCCRHSFQVAGYPGPPRHRS